VLPSVNKCHKGILSIFFRFDRDQRKKKFFYGGLLYHNFFFRFFSIEIKKMMLAFLLCRRNLSGGRRLRDIALQQSSSTPLKKVLVANRGEIACRVLASARDSGLQTVAVYSDADRHSMHVQMADEAIYLGAAAPAQSYLRQQALVDICKSLNVDAVHPGYGFLSENAEFAERVEQAGVRFIGPPASAIRAMGSKSASKEIMEAASVPCVPGYHGEEQSAERLREEASRCGYPLLIKAVLGGGGKGMRIVRSADALDEAVASAKREAMASFGDDRVLLERYVERPRHVEIQVFADSHGDAVYLFERDCSVQRRYQKVIEEAPAPGLSAAMRARMGETAVAAAKAVGYVGAGTVEFIVDAETLDFYFMEMNTRLQVEHPVTEQVSGEDLVKWQLHVAAGGHLPRTQAELECSGHAFEARIYAENPQRDFMPGSGRLVAMRAPAESEHVRVDTGVREGDLVSVHYDPMIAKLVVWDRDRRAALARMRTALAEFHVAGLATNIEFLKRLCDCDAFASGADSIETHFIEQHRDELLPAPARADSHALASTVVALVALQRGEAAGARGRLNVASVERFELVDADDSMRAVDVEFAPRDAAKLRVRIDGDSAEWIAIRDVSLSPLDGEFSAQVGDRRVRGTAVLDSDNHEVSLFDRAGHTYQFALPTRDFAGDADGGSGGTAVHAPMPGKVTKLLVDVGDTVSAGTPLLIMEAMKMEHTIKAPCDGTVASIHCSVEQIIDDKLNLVSFQVEQE
jgi:3-methylcrotonyl-CoA carboxylase alpha subunit